MEALLRMQFEAQLRHYAAWPGATRSLVLRDGEPVGCVVIGRQNTAIEIVDIAVLPTCQGQGVGSELIAGLQSEATREGKQIRLMVRRGNEGAKRLYERLGFIVEGGDALDLRMRWDPPRVNDKG